jgi:dTDP-4-dehydrorhamnose 3,5-epimerase
MIFTETPLAGAFVIDIEPIEDERGFFARTFCAEDFAARGLNGQFVQANTSRAQHAGTVRGLHYQVDPAAEAKLMRCVRGAIFDVIVDMREGSATRGKWFGIELTPENRRALYVPEYFAHGFMSLMDGTEVYYKTSAAYNPNAERGLRYNDPSIGIEWPMQVASVSDKDMSWPAVAAE